MTLSTLRHCTLSQNLSDSRGTSPASSALPGRIAHQLPKSPFQGSDAPAAQMAAANLSQLPSADSRGSLDGRASSGAERPSSAGAVAVQSDSRGLEGRAASGAEAAAPPPPRRLELRSMSLRPALQAGSLSSEPSATASALEASLTSTTSPTDLPVTVLIVPSPALAGPGCTCFACRLSGQQLFT